ncbi:hypothetical protein SAMN05421823_102113 [Catalinimonas alkaloidigena]|uniref:Uncharacterized protein n=1 Tax=Catalinimonas alkaloidigena TaxID=1075417 RepID=A0A1G8ZY72_9BACT|nr:hypothetical protein [Catalinimonas alkaloidigena]SDK19574.1 hypothetical protein SAMN05421823_102113 [Catalinimonas alkaloidigena]
MDDLPAFFCRWGLLCALYFANFFMLLGQDATFDAPDTVEFELSPCLCPDDSCLKRCSPQAILIGGINFQYHHMKKKGSIKFKKDSVQLDEPMQVKLRVSDTYGLKQLQLQGMHKSESPLTIACQGTPSDSVILYMDIPQRGTALSNTMTVENQKGDIRHFRMTMYTTRARRVKLKAHYLKPTAATTSK